MIGKQFGRLTVIAEAGKDSRRCKMFQCRCECGTVKSVRISRLKDGTTQSCGCLRREIARTKGIKTHGMTHSREYNSWHTMHQRCKCSKIPRFHLYGGKGVRVCERWASFENFYADMGPRPEGHSLDRIDSNGNYEPSNCRWATPRQQASNTRRNRFYTFNGKTQTEVEWSRELGIQAHSLKWRIAHWGLERALSLKGRQWAVVQNVFSDREVYP